LTDVQISLQIAGETLAIAALSVSAAAQNSQAPINTLTDLEAALLACWVPPPMEQSRLGMQDYGADELQAQWRAIRTAKDHFSIEGSVGDGTLVIPHRRRANAQTMCVFAVHGGARKHPSQPAAHHDLGDDREQTP
jgi:hypothetical protein